MLSDKDRYILHQLDINSRRSAAQIARLTGLRKETVVFRIKKLDCVKRYFAMADSSLLGYTNYKLYVHFQNINKNSLKNFRNHVIKIPELSWLAFCNGRYDAVLAFWAKNPQEFNGMVFSILSRFSKYIESKQMTANARWFICNRKWLNEKNRIKIAEFANKGEVKLDKTDAKIVELLSKNSRTPVIEIASAVGVSSPVVIQRIKKMQDSGYIKMFTLDLDLDKIGMELAKVLVTLQNATLQNTPGLLNYCKKHPNIRAIVHAIGPWDLELEIEVKSFRHLSEIIAEIRERFQIIKSAEVLMITEQYTKNLVLK